MDFTLIAVDSL